MANNVRTLEQAQQVAAETLARFDREFWSPFIFACSTFHYREIAALSRALGVNMGTISCWKHQTHRPRAQTAMRILNWFANGKPMRKIYTGQKGRPAYIAVLRDEG
jgi:hypothetical protein